MLQCVHYNFGQIAREVTVVPNLTYPLHLTIHKPMGKDLSPDNVIKRDQICLFAAEVCVFGVVFSLD